MEAAPGVLLSCLVPYLELFEIVRLERLNKLIASEMRAKPRVLDRVLKERYWFPDGLLRDDVSEKGIKEICREVATGSLKTLGFFIYDASVCPSLSVSRAVSPDHPAKRSSKSILKVVNFDQVNFPLRSKGKLYPLLIDFSLSSFRTTPTGSQTIMVFSSARQHQDSDILAYTSQFHLADTLPSLLDISAKLGLSYYQSFESGVSLLLFQGQNASFRPLFWAHFEELCSSVQFPLLEPVVAAFVYILIIQPGDSNSPQDWISTLRPSGKLVHLC